MRKHFGYLLVALLLVASPSGASISGICAAIQNTEAWSPGDLITVKLPDKTKTTLVTGECSGPCFSPVTADSIAFFLDGEIQIVKTRGGPGQTPTRTGILVSNNWVDNRTGNGMTALYWVRLSDGDYFYWVTSQPVSGGGVDYLDGFFRCKVGTSALRSYTLGKECSNYPCWGGVSADGTRGSIAVSANTACGFDLESETCRTYSPGCNTSVSPSGMYVMHDLPQGSWGNESTNWIIRNWSTGASVRQFQAPCCADVQRFSHFTDSVIMFHNYYSSGYRPNGCPAGFAADKGVIMNWFTNDTLVLGSCLAYDYFPDTSTGGVPQTAEPVINPGSGSLTVGAHTIAVTSPTPGASIRYTTDGSTPSTTSGTPIASGGTFSITLQTVNSTVTVKALAFKQGMSPSIIVAAQYSAIDTGVIVVTSPTAGQTYRVNDILHVVWTNYPAYNLPGMLVEISGNTGATWSLISTASAIAPGNSNWQNFAWQILPQVDNQSLAGVQAIIRVRPYTSGPVTVYGLSKLFTIAQTAAAHNEPRCGTVKPSGGAFVSWYTLTGRRLTNISAFPATVSILASRNAAGRAEVRPAFVQGP